MAFGESRVKNFCSFCVASMATTRSFELFELKQIAPMSTRYDSSA